MSSSFRDREGGGLGTRLWRGYIIQCIRRNIGRTLIWQIANDQCLMGLIFVVNDHGYDLNTLPYTWVKGCVIILQI